MLLFTQPSMQEVHGVRANCGRPQPMDLLHTGKYSSNTASCILNESINRHWQTVLAKTVKWRSKTSHRTQPESPNRLRNDVIKSDVIQLQYGKSNGEGKPICICLFFLKKDLQNIQRRTWLQIHNLTQNGKEKKKKNNSFILTWRHPARHKEMKRLQHTTNTVTPSVRKEHDKKARGIDPHQPPQMQGLMEI